MHSTFARTQPAFLLALALTVLAAFAPARWLGWTADVAEIARVPLRPFSHLGIKLAHWVRPPELLAPVDVPEEARAYVEHLTRELETYKQLYAAEQMEVDNLRRTLEQIQQVPIESRRPVRLLSASIISRTPSDRFGAVQLNRGTTVGVKSGTIALYDGVHLVGRIADATLVGSTLLPVANPATRLLLAEVKPTDNRLLEQKILIQLEPRGDGAFIADVDAESGVSVGDEVRVHDTTWPVAARGMIVGTIGALERIDEQPLSRRVVVIPRYQLHNLSHVTLKIEEELDELVLGANEGVQP